MKNIKYYKDYNHNYMILEAGDAAKEENYLKRMLSSNKIEGLLNCFSRDVNGAVYFYYDISSKASLENLYKGKKLSYGQVKELFTQLDGIYENLGRFFMDEKKLLLWPETIYYDLTRRKYFGVYYPDVEESGRPYEKLMDFLLEHIDAKDQRLTDGVYKIYEMSEQPDFLLSDALRFFDGPEEAEPDISGVLSGPEDAERNAEENGLTFENYHEDNYFEAGEEIVNHEDMSEKENMSVSKGKGKSWGVFALISLCGCCGLGFLYFNYELTRKETMTALGALAVMGLCFVFSLIQFKNSGKRAEKERKEEDELKSCIEDEFRDERPIALEGVLSRDMSADYEPPLPARNVSAACVREGEEERCGETVFMDMGKQRTEYKLYALDKKNKKHIELTQFPFTIGKMAGCVDCVLSDDSISRLHARIEEQDGRLFLTDMNSTNGTYKNGLRMQPSETVEIEAGDEIRFGRLSYSYR